MAYEHAPLDDESLGPQAARFVGANAPPKLGAVVAQGLAPLAPRDMSVALYQLWVKGGGLGEKAGGQVAKLPDGTLTGALDDPRLPAGVLDLFGRKLLRKAEILDRVVRHPMVDDQSLIGIARVCPELVCETLARSEDRWLRCPEIVASLYNNRHCPMSLVHRMLEMARREGVEIKMAGIEEIHAALDEDAEAGEVFDETTDQTFAKAMEVESQTALLDQFLGDEVDDALELPSFEMSEDDFDLPSPEAEPAQPEEPEKKLSRSAEIMAMRPSEKVRAALLGDKADRNALIRDSNRVVAMAAVKSPRVTDAEIVNWSSNRALNPDVIRYITQKRDWIKLYQVKLNLVFNPKTPLSKAMTFLAHLHRNDIGKVARSKGIPSALAKAAKRKLSSQR